MRVFRRERPLRLLDMSSTRSPDSNQLCSSLRSLGQLWHRSFPPYWQTDGSPIGGHRGGGRPRTPATAHPPSLELAIGPMMPYVGLSSIFMVNILVREALQRGGGGGGGVHRCSQQRHKRNSCYCEGRVNEDDERPLARAQTDAGDSHMSSDSQFIVTVRRK